MVFSLIPSLLLAQGRNFIVTPQFGMGISSPLQSSTIFSRSQVPRNGNFLSLGVLLSKDGPESRRKINYGINYVSKSYLNLYALGNKFYPDGTIRRIDDTLTASLSYNYIDFSLFLDAPLDKRNRNWVVRFGTSLGIPLKASFVGTSLRTGQEIESENWSYTGSDAFTPRFGTFHTSLIYYKRLGKLRVGLEAFFNYESPTISSLVRIRRIHGFHIGNASSGLRINVPIHLNKKQHVDPY